MKNFLQTLLLCFFVCQFYSCSWVYKLIVTNASSRPITISYKTFEDKIDSLYTTMTFNPNPIAVDSADLDSYIANLPVGDLPLRNSLVSIELKPGQSIYCADGYSFSKTKESFEHYNFKISNTSLDWTPRILADSLKYGNKYRVYLKIK